MGANQNFITHSTGWRVACNIGSGGAAISIIVSEFDNRKYLMVTCSRAIGSVDNMIHYPCCSLGGLPQVRVLGTE